MLVRSKSKNEKIVLGLLSYTEDDGVSDLKEVIASYQKDPAREIFLYRQIDEDNFVGILGVEFAQSEDAEETTGAIVIHKIAVIPSFRNEGVAYAMYCELRARYPQSAIIGSLETVDLIAKFAQRYDEESAPGDINHD